MIIYDGLCLDELEAPTSQRRIPKHSGPEDLSAEEGGWPCSWLLDEVESGFALDGDPFS